MKAEGLKKKFKRNGYVIKDHFLTAADCRILLSIVELHQQKQSLQHIYRKHRERSLDYLVIDGNSVTSHLPNVVKLYRKVNRIVNRFDEVLLRPLDDIRAAVNVNITRPGGEYRWHYDRNRVTALLYLNRVDGGEIQFYPKYRLMLRGRQHTRLQQWIDEAIQQPWIRRMFRAPVTVTPEPGRLLIMRGDITLHSVSPVRGEEPRINIVMAYDDV
jgi:hypothetical protein